ncbi:hypothetical protein R69888_04965 [Paraburkholderia haematera]|uniref:Uncharacterized protein n=1 Tax=Paraburkholderia haematera TaxID=2793077 RepID=A0ABM8S8T8_9BURK|nr:hypothetical protein R69888_04965 [Paraburkholderia haematera]
MQRIDQCVGARPIVAFREPLDHLFEILYPHGDVKPVEHTLATIAKVNLGAAHGVAAIGEESDRLIARKKSPHTIGRVVPELVNVREAMPPTVVSQ